MRTLIYKTLENQGCGRIVKNSVSQCVGRRTFDSYVSEISSFTFHRPGQMSFKPLPKGIYPVMLTPFTDDGNVDYPCLAALTRW